MAKGRQMQALYLMRREDGLWKIGISGAPYKRASQIHSQLKTLGFPMGIEVVAFEYGPNAAKLEKMLHAKYDRYREHGEYFGLPATEVEYVLNLIAFMGQSRAILGSSTH